MRLLLAGQRLAGEQGLVHEQVPDREQAAIGRHQIARLQVDHVSDHHLAHRDLPLDPVANHGRGLPDLLPEALRPPAGSGRPA